MQTKPRLPGESDEQYDIRQHKDIAAFSYLWIMSVVIYFTYQSSTFVRHHARQGIVLFLLSIPVAMIPFVGKIGMFLIVGSMLLGFVQASQGQMSELPVVYDLSKKDIKLSEVMKSAVAAARRGLDYIEKTLLHKQHASASKTKHATHQDDEIPSMDSRNKPRVP